MNRAFTLIEALAVVAILALVAATLAVSLGGAAQAAAWQRASSAVRQFDRLVRLEARTNGPIQIAIDGAAIVATRRNDHAPVLQSDSFSPAIGDSSAGVALVASHRRAAGTTPELTVLGSIQIDAAGRSIDFAYQLSDGTELHRLRVAGLTGYLWEGRD